MKNKRWVNYSPKDKVVFPKGQPNLIRQGVHYYKTVIGIIPLIRPLLYPQAHRAYETDSSMLCPQEKA